jgi:hypothetical protein
VTFTSSAVTQFVKRITAFATSNFTNSEANTKKKLIEPLLQILGWDLLSNEIQLEYPLRIGTSSAHVDYALILEEKPIVFIEAKAFDTALQEAHAYQIISYGKIEDVQWVVLTNGRQLKLFDTHAGKAEAECLVVELDLAKLPTKHQ